jgi:phage recombination protein Bet
MSLIVEIGGLRAIAARSGKYRPASSPTQFDVHDNVKNETNPLGLVRAVVTVHKQDEHGRWFDVVGEAWWDEHASVKDEWAYDDKSGKRAPTGNKTLEDNWKRMPRLMLAKCAESQALRKGWPEDLGGLFEQAESGGAWDADMLPTEVLEQDEAEARARRIGRVMGEYAVQFDMGAPIEMIAPGKLHDRVAEHVRSLETTMEIKQFRATNSETLKRYWADDKDAALSLKTLLDSREAELIKEFEGEVA